MGPKKQKKSKHSTATMMTYVTENDEVKVVPVDMDPNIKDEQEDGITMETPVQCPVCQKVVKHKYALKAHMKVHEDKSVQCDECDKMFSTAQLMKRHKQCKHMDMSLRPHPCTMCELRFLTKSKLEAHVKTHTQKRDVTCGLCFQSFYSKADLVRHMKGRHLNIRSFTCHVCHKGFFRKSYLKEHVEKIHMKPTEDDENAVQTCFRCRYCKEIFTSRTTCYAHERTHSGGSDPQRSLCMICGQTFSRPSSLKKHLAKHNNDPTFKCPHCDRGFYHPYSFKRHLNVHDRPDPDICQVCGNVYTNRDAFRRHLKKHVDRGDLAQVPPLVREEPRITKMQQLVSKGVGLDEILRTCNVEVVELGAKKNHARGKSREMRENALISSGDRSKWILNVTELNNSVRYPMRQHLEERSSWDGMDPYYSFPREHVDYSNNTVISRNFLDIVQGSGELAWDTQREWDTQRACVIFNLQRFCDTSDSTIEHNAWKRELTGEDILHKDVNAELFSTMTELEIPSYIEEIPELKPDIPRDLFHLYDMMDEISDIEQIDMTEDVFSVERLLQRNLTETLKLLEIVPRRLSECRGLVTAVSRRSSWDLEKAWNAFDGNIHSTLPNLGVTAVTCPRDWREFRTHQDLVDLSGLSETEQLEEIAQVLRGDTRVFWIKNLFNTADDSKDLDSIEIPKPKVKHEAFDNVASPDMNEFLYEDMAEPMQSDSEPDLKPDVKQLEANLARISHDQHKDKRKKRKSRKRLISESDGEYLSEGVTGIKSESEDEYRPKKSKRNDSGTEEEYKPKKLKKKKKTKVKRSKKGKKKKKEVKVEVKEEAVEVLPWEMMEMVNTEFICYYCDKEYANKITLRKHINSIHILANKTFSCHLCGISFVSKSRLEAHIENVHLKIRNFQCDQCEWGFYTRADLERHARRHTGVKPFMCHLCSKTFVRKAHLKTHISLHSGERKFICNMCGKTFATRSTLLTHLKRHTNQGTVRFYKTPGEEGAPRRVGPKNPVMCSHCGKELSTVHSLRRHIEFVHENPKAPKEKEKVQKAFQCQQCPSSFSHKTTLQRHMHLSHGRFKAPRTHSCPVCGRRLLNEACVMRHMVARHPYNCDNIDEMKAAIARSLQRNIPCPICKRKFLKEAGVQKHMAKKHYYKTEESDMGYVPQNPDLYNTVQPVQDLTLTYPLI